MQFSVKKALALSIGCLCAATPLLANGSSFFKNDDIWLLTGDSITYTSTYREATQRILKHFHPDNKITIANRAVWGVKSSYKAKIDGRPTVVTIMLGMNNIIHREYSHSPDFTRLAKNYCKTIGKQVDFYQQMGCQVVLLTPTLTDERISSFFSPMYTKHGLELMGKELYQLGKEKNCVVIPVAEELEKYEESLGPNQLSRPDGVHPFGEGQYRIAWSILQHLNAAGKLEGKRALSPIPAPVPVKVKRITEFLNEKEDKVILSLRSAKDIRFQLTWSLEEERGTQTIDLKANQETKWTLPASAKAYSMICGYQKQAAIDLKTSDGKLSFYLIDLARTKVVKPQNGEIKLEVRTIAPATPATKEMYCKYEALKGKRPEGDLIGTLRIRELNDELWLDGYVYDSEINTKEKRWITGRDNVQLMLDFRHGSRFANLTPDRDTTMVQIAPRMKPEFSLINVAWWSPRYQYAMHTYGKKTKDGYYWMCGYAGYVTDYMPFDIRKHDYYGVNMAIVDVDKKGFTINRVMPGFFPINLEKTLNQLIIVDRKNKFPHNETTTVQCFGF